MCLKLGFLLLKVNIYPRNQNVSGKIEWTLFSLIFQVKILHNINIRFEGIKSSLTLLQ